MSEGQVSNPVTITIPELEPDDDPDAENRQL